MKKGENQMGLDNGIVLRTKKPLIDIEVPAFIKVEKDFTNNEIEICYWRKCWNIREKVFEAIGEHDENAYEFEIRSTTLNKIIESLTNFLTLKEEWNTEESIWDFEEMIPVLTQNLLNLGWLRNYLAEDHMSYAIFYDSY